MATKQIQANPQNGNPIAEAVIALRGIANRFKGADKEFETLFTVCLAGVEKEPPSYEQSFVWHDAFLYLAENDPNLRRGAIVESIARRMLSAYEDDYLPQPPQNDPPFSSDFNKRLFALQGWSLSFLTLLSIVTRNHIWVGFLCFSPHCLN